jgi:redox-sensitive bicupin YhaK (pirin superfamily)
MRIGPHPHIGLQTVTWLVEGEALHTDSLGSEQLIRPGQLNLMTAGRGVAHAEESPLRGSMHGVQLWVAQPEATRHGAPDFEHHVELPAFDLGSFHLTVMIGVLAGVASPARADTSIVGADLASDGGRTIVPLDEDFEHALLVVAGTVEIHGEVIQPGVLAYLGTGRDELPISTAEPSRALLIGGRPFGEEVLMWWNFVARTRDEIDEAYRDWEAYSDRFGDVASGLARIPAPAPVWVRPA